MYTWSVSLIPAFTWHEAYFFMTLRTSRLCTTSRSSQGPGGCQGPHAFPSKCPCIDLQGHGHVCRTPPFHWCQNKSGIFHHHSPCRRIPDCLDILYWLLVLIDKQWFKCFFLAAKQFYEWFSPSVCPSVCPSHRFHYVPITILSWNFRDLLPFTEMISIQKFKVRGQWSRSQKSKPNLAISGLLLRFEFK